MKIENIVAILEQGEEQQAEFKKKALESITKRFNHSVHLLTNTVALS